MTVKMQKWTQAKGGTRYALAAEPDDLGYFTLYLQVRGLGSEPVGLVADPENFETAVDTAEEEARCMMADFREEVGITQTATGFKLG